MRVRQSKALTVWGALLSLALAVSIHTMTLAVPMTTIAVLIPIKSKGSGPFYRFLEDGKWGYMDRQGMVVIPPRFDQAEDFFEHKAMVRFDGDAGYIRESGEWMIEPKFGRAGRFRGGVAIAGERRAAAVGLIDAGGNFLVAPQFTSIEDFPDG